MAEERTGQLGARLARVLENFNVQGAHNVLDEIFGAMSIDAALSEVILPYLHELETRSPVDAATIAHVHFSAGLLESRLLALASGWESGGEPTVLLAYPEDESHPFAGIAFGLAMRDRGWRIIYLGPGAAPHEVTAAARATGAGAIVLVVRSRADFGSREQELIRLGARRILLLADGGDGTAATARSPGTRRLSSDPVRAAEELDRRHRSGATRVMTSAETIDRPRSDRSL